MASSAFARRYWQNRCFFLFLRVLRCFSSPRSPPYVMYWRMDTCALPHVGSPIRKSADQWICAPHRSLSQLITSFIGSQCQGIHLMLLLLDQITSRFSHLKRKSLVIILPDLALNQVFQISLLFSRCEFVSGFSQQIDLMNRYPFSISFQRSACISIRCLFVTLGIVLFNFQGTVEKKPYRFLFKWWRIRGSNP